MQSNDSWPDPDQAHLLMEVVLQHFVTHHKVVVRKLHVAQEATLKSLEELESRLDDINSHSDAASLDNIRRYEHMWGQIIEMFKAHGATEQDLDRIEQVLLTIPRTIKKYYEVMIEQDRALKAMIASLDSDEYRKATAVINKVQSRPNPMSGLTRDDYDEDLPVYNVPIAPSYEISVESMKNHD